MSNVFTEDFDGVTAPTLPSTITAAGTYQTSATHAQTSPNSVVAAVTGGLNAAVCYFNGADDGNGGNSVARLYVGAEALVGGVAAAMAYNRMTTPTISNGTLVGYRLYIDFVLGRLQMDEISLGAGLGLGHVDSTDFFTVPEHYILELETNLHLITGRVQRQSDGHWLDNSGAWQSSIQDCIVATDYTVTGAGYAGFAIAISSMSNVLWVDDLSLDTVVAPIQIFIDGSPSDGPLYLSRAEVADPSTAADGSLILSRAEIPDSFLPSVEALSMQPFFSLFDDARIGVDYIGVAGGAFSFDPDGPADASSDTIAITNYHLSIEDQGSAAVDGFAVAPYYILNEPDPVAGDLAMAAKYDASACAASKYHSGIAQNWSISGKLRNITHMAPSGPDFFHNNLTGIPLTAFWFSYSDPFVVKICGGAGVPGGVDECVYQTTSLSHATTDKNGAFSFTNTGMNMDACQILIGTYIKNPIYDPINCGTFDAWGNSSLQEYILDRSDFEWRWYAGLSIKQRFTPNASSLSAFNALMPTYAVLLLGPDSPGEVFYGTSSNRPGDSTSWIVDAWVDNNRPLSIYGFANGAIHDVTPYYANAGQGRVRITDGYGRSGICYPIYPTGNLGLMALAISDGVEWWYVTKVELLDYTPTFAEIMASPIKSHRPDGPQSDYFLDYGVKVNPPDTNFSDTRSQIGNRIMGPGEFYALTGMAVDPALRNRSVSSFKDTVVFAWINDAGALKVARHRSIKGHIGHPTDGWLATQTLMTANAAHVAVTFIHTSRCYIAALDTSTGSGKLWVSDDNGDTWTPTTEGAAFESSDFGQGLTAACYVNASGGDSAPFFAQLRDNKGASWVTETVIGSGGEPTELFAGIAFLKSGWAMAWNFGSEVHTAFTTGYPASTVTAGLVVNNTVLTSVTTLSGKCVGMVRGGAGSLIMLLYDTTARTSRLAWSGDRGKTWRQMASAMTLVPTMMQAPAIVALEGGYAAVCWQESDVPKFRLTLDTGRTVQ